DAARHPPERRRAALDARLQDRAERIQVVAGDEHARGGQFVHEMPVAVIDDVEDVRLAAKAAHAPRVVPEAAGEAIERERWARPARAWQPGRTRRERRTHELDVDAGGVLTLEALDEHVRHQVHAWPAFLREIRDD